MRIYNNIASTNANRRKKVNNNKAAKSLEKLASGLAINRAADDAAGLAISSSIRSMISGLERASKNAQDGVSLIQTSEGALDEINAMLDRMIELAVQSKDGINRESDKKNLNTEFKQLLSEIDSIAQNTKFNGIGLLMGADGISGSDLETISGFSVTEGKDAISASRGYDIERLEEVLNALEDGDTFVIKGFGGTHYKSEMQNGTIVTTEEYREHTFTVNKGAVWGDELEVSGVDISDKPIKDNNVLGTLYSILEEEMYQYDNTYTDTNSHDWTVYWGTGYNPDDYLLYFTCESPGKYSNDFFTEINITRADGSTTKITPSSKTDGSDATETRISFSGEKEDLIGKVININGTLFEFTNDSNKLVDTAVEVNITNATSNSDIMNILANAASGSLYDADTTVSGSSITFKPDQYNTEAIDVLGWARAEDVAVKDVFSNMVHFGVSHDDSRYIGVPAKDMRIAALGISRLDISTTSGAQAAVTALYSAVEKVSTYRAELGATQNRFEHTMNNLNNLTENLKAAESRIRDTDMAIEMSRYNKYNILQQAGDAMIAQANSQPQSILSLLQ